jgi:hypothetical protein
VVPAQKKLHAIAFDQIDPAMLKGDPARPDSATDTFQGFGLADAAEGIAQLSIRALSWSRAAVVLVSMVTSLYRKSVQLGEDTEMGPVKP